MLRVDRARGDEQFELFLGKNNIARVVLLLHQGLRFIGAVKILLLC